MSFTIGYDWATATNGGSLSCMSVFFVIIAGFRRRLTKLLFNAVLVLFCGKSGIFQFVRSPLSMRVISTHQSLNVPPFDNVPNIPTYSKADYFSDILILPSGYQPSGSRPEMASFTLGLSEFRSRMPICRSYSLAGMSVGTVTSLS